MVLYYTLQCCMPPADLFSTQNEYSHKERQLTQQLQVTTDTLLKTETQVKQLQGLVTVVMMMSCDVIH